MRKMLLSTGLIMGLAAGLPLPAWAQTAAVVAPEAADAAPAPAKAPPTVTKKHRPMRATRRHVTPAADAPVVDGEIRPGHEPGIGDSYPASDKASNTEASTTRSRIAPRLPTPAGGVNASVDTYLRDAEMAMNARHTGRAQEALERAETAMLQRSVPADQAANPSQATDVMQVEMARKALGEGNMTAAKRAVTAAMAASGQPGQ